MRRAFALLAIGAGAFALWIATAQVPSFEEVKQRYRGSEAWLLDRDGQPLQQLRLDASMRQLDWTPLDAVSPALLRTLVGAEDRRFAWHPGVDPIALASAAIDNLRRAKPRGASTLTMQLASLLDSSTVTRPNAPSSLRAKLAQMRSALALTARWSKREVLEAHLNLAPFRGELRGIAAASHGWLGRAPAALDAAESALLVAMLPAPNAAKARIGSRACVIAAADAPLCDRIAFLAGALPRRYSLPIAHDDAPHLARRLLKHAGESVRSTLDGPLQRFARDALREQLRSLAGRNADDGALVVLDNASGDVLAYVGSSGELSAAAEVDGITALRQPGSTLKPFLFALAIEAGWLTAASVLDDSPLAIATPTGAYLPQNYDRDFRGQVSLRTALAGSLNVPAVRTLTLVGLPRFHERLRAAGFDSLTREAEHYGYGLALGGAEVDLLALANAYRTLANGGLAAAARFTPDQPRAPAQRVFDARASFIIADILADRGARAGTFGLASSLDTASWSAVKTGTSKAMRDNWAVGFSDRFTVAVWVGNFAGAPMHDVSGVAGAAPVLRALLDHLHADRPAQPTAPPEGLVRRDVRFANAVEPPRAEWFIAGTEVATIEMATRELRPRILSPAAGAILAIDPDIPASRQTLLVQVRGLPRGASLALDTRPLAAASTQLIAVPTPGRHRVVLRGADGNVIDEAQFEVRGLPRSAARSTHSP